MPEPTPNVVSEILKWSEARPLWQRDALRRILATGGITPLDLDELEQLCRSPHGVAQAQNIQATPLSEEHSGQTGAAMAKGVSLVSISNLQNVNRLPADTQLTFGPSPGLTVVFGVNAAGKSGYARVLKKACQSRGAPPEILPNAHLPKPVGPARSTIAGKHGNLEFSHDWIDGGAPSPLLSQVFVFDSATANNYLAADGPTTFTPFGLDILPKLSNTCDRIRERIDSELESLRRQCQSRPGSWRIPPNTPTYVEVSQLSAKTTKDEAEHMTCFSAADEKQKGELEAALKSDPRQKAKETRASAERIETFAAKLKTRFELLGEEQVAIFAKQVSAAGEAQSAARAFSQNRFAENCLPGTGSDVWKRLWKAAREFSEASAYAQQSFPVVSEGARCLLCQQELKPDATKRFGDFQAFMADQSQLLLAQTRSAVEGTLKRLEKEVLLVEELKRIEADVDEQLVQDLRSVTSATDQFLSEIIEQIKSGKPPVGKTFNFEVQRLTTKSSDLRTRAGMEEGALDPQKKSEMAQSLLCLQAREAGFRHKESVFHQLHDLQRIAKLEACSADLQTRGITLKNAELTEKMVTRAYVEAFANALKALGLASVSAKIVAIAGRKGETKYGLRMAAGESGTPVDLSGIASEGEQRCIALAAFLAELSQASHLSTLVFDDPVCSLDHHFRAHVARVLAQESTRRQVVVFTHDLVFLQDLQTAAEDLGVSVAPRTIEWDAGGPGRCYEDLPWEGKKVDNRLQEIDKRIKALKAACSGVLPQSQRRELLDIFSHLRGTLERLVEDKILEGGLTRYQNQVKVGKLRALVGFSNDEFNLLAKLHTCCSEAIRAHDSASARQLSTPSLADLEDAVKNTRGLLDLVKSRKDAIKAACGTGQPNLASGTGLMMSPAGNPMGK